VIYLPYGEIGERYPGFKTEILKNNSVLNVSIKNSLPVEVADKTSEIYWEDKNADADVLVEATAIGFDYFQTMGMNISSGRDFSSDLVTDKGCIILNKEAARMMGLNNPIGENITIWDYTLIIIGLADNAMFYSLKENIGPQIYYMVQDYDDEQMKEEGVILLKIDGENIEETMASVKAIWEEFVPDSPFDFHFLDQVIDNKYQAEKSIFSLLKYFVLISILISCLGLFGLAAYSTQSRIKEIGVRKVNGAKISEVLMMLNKDFIKWVAIAFIIATPIAWYAMYKWLESFAYKTNLSWWIFVLAGILALGVALLTVSWQSWRAATRNPVEALRYE
jgi:putative ABC transport system permease protein